MLTATRPRKHACKFCQKAFRRAEHLHRHVLSHENKKPHSCQSCGASFGRPDVLTRHLRKCADYSRGVAPKSQLSTNQDSSQTSSLSPSLGVVNTEASYEHIHGTDDADTPSATIVVDTRSISEPINDGVPSCRQAALPNSLLCVQNTSHPRAAHSSDSTGDILDPRFRVECANADQFQMFNASLGSITNDINGSSFQGEVDCTNSRPSISQPDPETSLELSWQNSPGQMLSWETYPMINAEELSGVNTNEFMFLGGTLLPDFNVPPMNFSSPFDRVNDVEELCQMTPANTALSTRDRILHSSPPEDQPCFQDLQVSRNDADSFKEAALQSDRFGILEEFTFPTHSRMKRFLEAYFEYFDPHTPIVHQATFDPVKTSPTLVLAMLAIGGIYLSEHHVANSYFNAACGLLTHYEIGYMASPDPEAEIWPIQASLLCIQFGHFTDNLAYHRRAQRQFSFVSLTLSQSLNECQKYRTLPELTWGNWILLETYSRLACWAVTLNGIILAFDPDAICIFTPLVCKIPIPCEESIWRAGSSSDWSNKGGQESQRDEVGLWTAAETLLLGHQFLGNVSSFGLLGLLGTLMCYLCSHERLNPGLLQCRDSGFIQRLERSLINWESLWRQHPHAAQPPKKTEDPLMDDSISLLQSAYYHLYVGVELRALKSIAGEAKRELHMPRYEAASHAYKGIKHAARSWLKPAKVGIIHLRRTAALMYGGHAVIAAYEAALILSWWLSLSASPTAIRSTREDSEGNHQSLENILEEIFNEIADQGILCDQQDSRILTPISFYRPLLKRWVWTVTGHLEDNLVTFANKLVNSPPNILT